MAADSAAQLTAPEQLAAVLGPQLLCAAAAGGHVSTVSLLLHLFPAAVTVPVYGLLPIHCAAQTGAPAAVAALIEAAPHTAMAAAQDSGAGSSHRGFTPLHFSCLTGNVPTAFTLLNAAPVATTVRDAAGRLPLHIAAWQGREGVIELLLQAAPSTARMLDGEQRTAAHIAAFFGQADALRMLLAAAPDTARILAPSWCQSHPAGSPLHLAASRGHVAAVSVLLEIAPDLALARDDALRQTPLHAAVRAGHLPVVQLLLGRAPAPAALVEAGDKYGNTVTHAAAVAGNADVLQVALRRGVQTSRESPGLQG